MSEASELLKKIIKYVPEIMKVEWKARECIIEMMNARYKNWKQTEWIGFYFEYITEKVNIPGISQLKYFIGNTSFNGCTGNNIIDYKTSSNNVGIILNDQGAIRRVVDEYGELVYIVLNGRAESEINNEIDEWRQTIAGKSKYIKAGEVSKRRHRKMKSIFMPENLLYLSINKNNIEMLKNFKQGKNSDGRSRAMKYMIPANILHYFLRADIAINMYRGEEKNELQYI